MILELVTGGQYQCHGNLVFLVFCYLIRIGTLYCAM